MAPFQHSMIPNLSQQANSLLYDYIQNSEKAIESTQVEGNIGCSQPKPIVENIPTEKVSSSKKRTLSEVSDMEVEQQEGAKKQKIVTSKEIIDIEQIEEQKFQFASTVIEDEVSQQITESG